MDGIFLPCASRKMPQTSALYTTFISLYWELYIFSWNKLYNTLVWIAWYILIRITEKLVVVCMFFHSNLAISIEEDFLAILIVRRLPCFTDAIPISLASIKPTFIITFAPEFGGFWLLLLDLLAFCKNFGLKARPISFPFCLIYSSKDFGLLLSFSLEADLRGARETHVLPVFCNHLEELTNCFIWSWTDY